MRKEEPSLLETNENWLGKKFGEIPHNTIYKIGAQKHHKLGSDGPADLVAGCKKLDPPSFATAGATLWRQENAREVHLKKEFAVGAASLVHESGAIILVFDPFMGVKRGTSENSRKSGDDLRGGVWGASRLTVGSGQNIERQHHIHNIGADARPTRRPMSSRKKIC